MITVQKLQDDYAVCFIKFAGEHQTTADNNAYHNLEHRNSACENLDA